MSSRVEAGMKEVLQKALAVSRELDTLQREHQTLLTQAKNSEEVVNLSDSYSEAKDEEHIGRNEFVSQLREEKIHTVTSSLSAVQKGIEETQLMIMVANYITSLEGDRLKLKAQVKRLCAENNWLRESLTESQQLLQEAEVSMGKLKVDKEHLEFLQSQQGGPRESLVFNSYPEEQESEMMDAKEEMPLSFPVEARANLPHDLEATLDYEIPEKIRMLHQLALQHVNQGKPEVAIPLCRKAVQELEQKTGRNNPDLATLLNILAVIYREQGRFKEAIRVLQETLEIREHVFGPTHAAVASTLNNLSVLHGKCGDFKTAEPFCQRALEIRQALLGPDHPDVAKQFCNLAVLSSNLGRYDEVEHYYLRALEVFQMELGPDDPNVTKTMNKLANCYLKQGKYKAAEAMFKKVLKTVHNEESSGQNHREGGGASSERGSPSPQIGEAGYWHKLSPLESPTVTDTLRCLTDTYRGQGRMEDAAELERLSKERKLDKTHQDRITRIVGEESSSEKLIIEEKNESPISKKQGLPKNTSSKASLTWKWVVGQRTGTPKLTDQNYSSNRPTKQHK